MSQAKKTRIGEENRYEPEMKKQKNSLETMKYFYNQEDEENDREERRREKSEKHQILMDTDSSLNFIDSVPSNELLGNVLEPCYESYEESDISSEELDSGSEEEIIYTSRFELVSEFIPRRDLLKYCDEVMDEDGEDDYMPSPIPRDSNDEDYDDFLNMSFEGLDFIDAATEIKSTRLRPKLCPPVKFWQCERPMKLEEGEYVVVREVPND